MIDNHEMHKDDHWLNLQEPLKPSLADVTVYRNNIVGSNILLLGSTQRLLSLATSAVDIYPKYADVKIKKGNWLEITDLYDTVLVDGCFNFNETLTDRLINHYSSKCARIVARCFKKRLSIMKYASYFPTINEFMICPTVISEYDEYSFYLWEFE